MTGEKGKRKFSRITKYESPEALYVACVEYFEWCDSNPHYKERVVMRSMGNNGGSEPMHVSESHPRMYSMGGLTLFIGVSQMSWGRWKDPMDSMYWPEGNDVQDWAESVVRENKLNGAAVGFFNSSIVSKVLGLVERQDLTTGGDSIAQSTTIDVEALTVQERKALLAAVKRPPIEQDELLS